jgi:hypothetical protein
MAGLTAFTCLPSEIREHVIECISVGLVPFIKSSPGMGKSSIVRSIAEEYNLLVIDVRLSQATPEDLQGLPRFREILDQEGKVSRTVAEFVPFNTFPIESTSIPEGYAGWLLFFDEYNSGSKQVQAATYKIILDKMVGQDRLHPNVAIVCAGNLETDRAIVNTLSTAMQSRMVHLTMKLSTTDFINNVAFKQHWDERVIAYLSYKENALHDFDPEHNDATFCCPRTWDFMNRLIKGKDVTPEKAALYAGTITSGVATEFITFTKVFASLPNIHAIIQTPTTVEIPLDPATRFATVTHLVGKVTDDTFEPVATYVNRMTAELRVIFFRGLMIQQPDMRTHPMFKKSMLELSKYLNDDEKDSYGAGTIDATGTRLSAA